MIKANELRIGNWVERTETLRNDIIGYVQFDLSDWYAIGECMDYLESYKPIYLNSEILKNCGFIFGIQLQDFVKGKYQFVEIKNIIDGYFSEEGFFYYGLRTKLQYLHQLQNLYFALTGEELEVTL
jgi:hypothetical protein